VEFIAVAPQARVKLAQLVTLNILTGQNGDDDPARPLFNIQLASEGEQAPAAAADKQIGHFVATMPRFAGLATAPIAAERTVFFREIQPTQFFMDVAGKPEHAFDPNRAPDIVAIQGTVEEWTVENHTLENHEFHFHHVHFLLESQNNFEINGDQQGPGIVGQFLDMVEVPNWDGNPAHPYPSVKIRIDFRGPDIGIFVFHCHILNHEDLGMMNIIQVVPAPGSTSVSKGNVGPAAHHGSAKARPGFSGVRMGGMTMK
jgi:FtsP/CotA-like multicopper oxidase with cupredoxin domain